MAKKILIVDDDQDIRLLLDKFLSKNGYETKTAYDSSSAIETLKSGKCDLVLCDFKLPDINGLELIQKIKVINPEAALIIITGYSDVKVAVKAIKLGVYDYVTKPLYPDEILITIEQALNNKKDQSKPKKPKQKKFIIGDSPQANQVMKHIKLIAPTDMSVIIQGETGTGKEFVANEIHNYSKRKAAPFVAIDCGALPKDLAGSELFGHVKGAFTGALNDKEGSFESANGGTLFLDEIGNLSYENQVKLLRVIQERKIKKIGGTKDIPIDVRLIVATNENLSEAVKQGDFREDLYHRFNEFKIYLAPLRERSTDVKVFARYFLDNANQELGKEVKDFEPEVLAKMKDYYWHGNLRELYNVVKRSVLLAQTDKITLECLPEEIKSPVYFEQSEPVSQEAQGEPSNLKSVSKIAEREAIISVLEKTGYNKTKAADVLNIDRKTLYNKMKSYNIDL
ncbi:two-component system response regulator HydG [Catalinimonas alkaloidigena]|uniref:sigma-54-dependent transcriptional regulator n=1 Tax=Catalinimonas alkaloidigena TaxID=1075417 RepID=UPI0024056CD3|nr:sigma-54 dependent transcriptional regulator [Catalinimonas alkaloidigena]MDF9796937.1 two-component system response regulator HydG [Catalinimonas alkaloidigena]